MRSRTVVALLALAAVPCAALPEDGEWGEGPAAEPSDVRPAGGYDVSVDLNVQDGVSVDAFYGALSPYGQWIVVGNYGRVWRPNVPAGWRPYYYGRWEWTNEGWLWVSDEPWGWAAYHYGRWTYDPYNGWIWVPGSEWAPAWVAWRTSGDVVGWAPLAPGYSVYVSSYPFIDFWWTFVPCTRFVSVPVYSVAYGPALARRHFYATAPAPAARPSRPGRAIGYAPAWGGPAPRTIEQRLGRPLAPARIVAAPAPGARGRQGEIPVYRPEPRVATPRPGPAGRPDGNGGPSRVVPPRGGGRGPAPVAPPGWPGSGRVQQGARAGGGGEARGAVQPPAPRGGAVGAPSRAGGAPERGGGMAPAPHGGMAPAPRGGAAPAPRGGAAGPPARGGGAPGRGGGMAPAPRSGGGRAGRGDGGERGGR